MRGEFAFSLHDSERNVFIAGRDRFGIKPLFYAVHDGRLIVGSEVKALFAMGVPAAWNPETMTKGGFAFTSSSIYGGVHQVPPGHYLIATPNGNIRLVQYWDMTYANKDSIDHRTDSEMIKQTHDKLLNSIELRMHADVPVSVYLSGGLDSCAVLGFASTVTKRKIDAYTISFTDDKQFDERLIAKRMATHTNANFHTLEITSLDIAQNYEKCVYHVETPMFNGNGVAKYMLSKFVRDSNRKCVLTGEGSDEVFCGYSFFRQDYIERLDENERLKIVKELKSKNLLGIPKPSDTTTAKAIRKIIGHFPAYFKLLGESNDVSTLFSDETKSRIGSFDPLYEFISETNGSVITNMRNNWDPVHSSMYLWAKSALLNNLLVFLGDRCEMAHSVEGRLPFLDHELVELVNAMPLHIKLRNMQEKYLLREAAKPYITTEVYERQKHPFLAPPAALNRNNPMYHLVQETLRGEDMRNVAIYDHKKVIELADEIHNSQVVLDIPRQLALDHNLHQLIGMAFLQKQFNPVL
jgi:asparagine synthase (glutamine-hydrolysing)